jgi:hypothetical protein
VRQGQGDNTEREAESSAGALDPWDLEVALLQSPVALWAGEGPYASLSTEAQARKVTTMKEAPLCSWSFLYLLRCSVLYLSRQEPFVPSHPLAI